MVDRILKDIGEDKKNGKNVGKELEFDEYDEDNVLSEDEEEEKQNYLNKPIL
jgi:hypothetical protein